MRAYQVYTGNYFPQKHEPKPGSPYRLGGSVDFGIVKLDRMLTKIAMKPHERITPELQKKTYQMVWNGETWVDTPNVSIYPPFLYFPAAFGISISKKYSLQVADTVRVSRWCNLLCGIALASLAILMSGRYVFYTTAILFLPIVMSQMASTSQDAIMFPLSAIAAAILIQLQRPVTKTLLFILSIILGSILFVLATSRPPYTALAMLFLPIFLLKKTKWEQVILATVSAITIVAGFAWAFYVAKYVSVPFGRPGVSYFEQVNFILANPFQTFLVLFNSICEWARSWTAQVVGVLGWMDTVLPKVFYYITALWLILLFYFFHKENRFPANSKRILQYKAMQLSILLFTFLGMLVVIYISWTPVGKDLVEGFQGRYLIPLVFLAIPLFMREKDIVSNKSYAKHRLILLLFYGVTGTIVSIYALFDRFYGSFDISHLHLL